MSNCLKISERSIASLVFSRIIWDPFIDSFNFNESKFDIEIHVRVNLDGKKERKLVYSSYWYFPKADYRVNLRTDALYWAFIISWIDFKFYIEGESKGFIFL